MNTWPGGKRHAMDQSEHEKWNASHYPGTRQLCELCETPTESCEEDSMYAGDDGEIGPLCEACFEKLLRGKGL
jgi:hypothetical protein